MSIISTHNLTVGYRNAKAESVVMQGLNVSLERGRLTALLGSNGIGKSTLLRTISGAQPMLDGDVTINGRSVNEISRKEMSMLLSMVFTDRTQAGGLTVRELVSLGRQPHTGFLGRLDDHDREVVNNAVKAVGVSHKIDCYVAELSDGERQKVMIAKALAQETPVIILDEPTAFLDVASRIEIMRLLSELAHTADKAILLSTHDVSQTLILADELWVVTKSRTLLAGMTEDLILSGAMGQMFNTDAVKFNMLTGDYEVAIPSVRKVELDCTDAELRRWICNALRRNGIAVGESGTKIAATACDKISVNGVDGITSISDLVDYLKNRI